MENQLVYNGQNDGTMDKKLWYYTEKYRNFDFTKEKTW